MHHPIDRIAHTTAFVTPVVEHWLEREIAQWVSSVVMVLVVLVGQLVIITVVVVVVVIQLVVIVVV